MHFLLEVAFLGIFCCRLGIGDHIFAERGGKIAFSLNEHFTEDNIEKANVIVTFTREAGEVFNTISLTEFPSDAEFHETAITEMQLLSKETQEECLEFLRGLGNQIEVKSWWMPNQIYVKGATKEICEAISSFQDVALIEKEKVFEIHEPIHDGPIIERVDGEEINAGEEQWNIQLIRASEAWSKSNGAGAVVGVIDTGCRASHECFEKGFMIGWLDAVNKKTTAYDDNGHGTHVTSTICGGKGIGVAPGTKIISCKACTGDGTCSQNNLNDCCQFMTQQKPDCVSNSWGGPSGVASYTDVINSWKSLGMCPIFSAGNSGPNCGSIGSPADYTNVMSVGATTSSDSLADFSSRGACKSGQVGPTVCAPGHKIMAAWSTSDTAYNTISGTSMAAPHVSGMVALLHTANPSANVNQLLNSVIQSCKFGGLGDNTQNCGATSASQKPNNMYGHGRIDCMNGMQMLQNEIESTKLEARAKNTTNIPSYPKSQHQPPPYNRGGYRMPPTHYLGRSKRI